MNWVWKTWKSQGIRGSGDTSYLNVTQVIVKLLENPFFKDNPQNCVAW